MSTIKSYLIIAIFKGLGPTFSAGIQNQFPAT